MRLEDWLDDLCVRFMINLPETDLTDMKRLCFHVEEAQWYYEDFIRPLDPTLPSMNLRSFTSRIFAHCPLLASFSREQHMVAFQDFMAYKQGVPVRGTIMVNHEMDSVLLVKGWKSNSAWMFPRGKMNMDEDPLTCAIRETYEETGFDIDAAGLIPQDRNVKYITIPLKGQDVRLYVIRNVPMDFPFAPRTRKEISKIDWWRIVDLPGSRKGTAGQQHVVVNNNKFYMVPSFMRELKRWIAQQKKLDANPSAMGGSLAAAAVQEELLTEEEFGGPEALVHDTAPTLDKLEDATAALRELLKLQPPTQGLQTDAMRSPVAKDTGSELLALLQGTGPATSQGGLAQPPPQTPLEQVVKQAPIPETPHHQQPRYPQLSHLPPPPSFSTSQQPDSFSYQEPRFNQQPNQAFASQGFNRPHDAASHRHPHYQPQHLVHPQPLPPQVQRAVFTGGPVHAPLMPPVQQSYPSQTAPTNSHVPSHPQFPNVHAPMVPPVQKPSPPKLTSHALALLNAFKSRDQANGNHEASNDSPLQRYEQQPGPLRAANKTNAPQELPADVSRPGPVDLLSLLKAKDSPAEASALNDDPPPTPGRPAISDAHKSSLLDLFKSPRTQKVVPVTATATALPQTPTPSAVELSAVEPLSSTTVPIHNSNSGELKEKTVVVPQLHPEANLPFRALTILSRPAQPESSNSTEKAKFPGLVKSQNNGNKSLAPRNRDIQHNIPLERPFQPQILKRPQPGSSNAQAQAQVPAPMPAPVPAPAPASSPSSPHLLPNPQTTKVSPTLSMPLLGSGTSTPAAPPPDTHKANLLSLFGNPSTTSSSIPKSNVLLQQGSPESRSRVGSLTLKGGQTPMSSADKNFLLNYLDGVAKGTSSGP